MYVGNLLNSQLPHNGECPFMCAVCKKSFKEADALMMHLHTHTGGRPFTFGFFRESFKQLVRPNFSIVCEMYSLCFMIPNYIF